MFELFLDPLEESLFSIGKNWMIGDMENHSYFVTLTGLTTNWKYSVFWFSGYKYLLFISPTWKYLSAK